MDTERSDAALVAAAARAPWRVAMLSVHTSPLDQPGAGDAGGLNVYVVETSTRIAAAGIPVEIFTRATSSSLPPTVELAPGVLVRHVSAGPYEGLSKQDLPAQLCAFTAAVLRAEAQRELGWYSLIHSHYWLSGQVGWLARDRWRVPLVHSAHTLAKVKNASLADDDDPEPLARIIGEEQVVAEADQLVAATRDEAADLVELYGADPGRVAVVPPGVDLQLFSPGDQAAARQRLGVPPDALLSLFVGRLQPLKAPDLALRAVAELLRNRPDLADRLHVAVLGAPSGSAVHRVTGLADLAATLGLAGRVSFVPPVPRAELADWFRAADLTLVPSHSESFGLVALESQACGTPVVAADVGGLPTVVADGRGGVLLDGHGPEEWAKVVGDLLAEPRRRAGMAVAARRQAEKFSWQRTADGLLRVYSDAAAAYRATDKRAS
jgi:D-inositol-3-phosphate glycosyltransferase